VKAAAQWGELGTDARELECLRYGIYDKPDRDIAPFTLPFSKLDEVDSAEMEAVIEKRIEGRVWREMTRAEAGRVKYISREFIARDSDGKSRAVAEWSHLSIHYDGVITKSEEFEGFAASMLLEVTVISMDLKSGYHHLRLHPDMREYFSVSVMTADGMVRYFQYIALPLGWSRNGYWFIRIVTHFWTHVKRVLGYRVLSCIDNFLICPSLGHRATEEDFVKASMTQDGLVARYRLIRHPRKGVRGRGSQVVMHSGFVVDTKRGKVGVPSQKLDNISERARKLLARGESINDVFPPNCWKRLRGKLRVSGWPFQIRISACVRYTNPCRSRRGHWFRPWHGRGQWPFPTLLLVMEAVFVSFEPIPRISQGGLSHPALRDLQFWRDLPRSLQHRPLWPEAAAPAATVHTDASLTAYGATLAYVVHDAGCTKYRGTGMADIARRRTSPSLS
jgi:hypothetical protein